jgi:hypothetical protein
MDSEHKLSAFCMLVLLTPEEGVPWSVVVCFNSSVTTLQGADARCHGDAVEETLLFLY